MPSTEQIIHEELPADAGHATGGRRRWRRFALHYLEMVVAMVVGMVVLGGALRAGLSAAGVEYSMARFPELVILEMGLTMALGMAAWMRYRGHGWASTLEMSAAMLVPAAAVVPPVWLGVLGAGAAMTLEHVAMFPLMLAVMLRRRDEYTMDHGRSGRVLRVLGRGRVVRALGRGLVVLVAFPLVPAAVYAAGSATFEQGRYTPPELTPTASTAVAAATPPAHDPGKPTAVVVVGNGGANVADTLVPYDVLATTGAFNVYTVAPERSPLPLLGGLDLVPDLSFAQLDERLGGSAPDVTIVPEMPNIDESNYAGVIAWLRDTASDGLLVSVCTGARLLAEAGLLDGRDATSHWHRIDGLHQRYPQVNWQRGIRYIDDGDVITTGGLLSSVDGTLRVIERVVGTDAAAAAAQAVGWLHYSPGTAAKLPRSQVAPTDAIMHILNIGFRANTTTMGVVLTDGVGELELAAAFAPYAEVKSARTVAITEDGDSIRSRHGLTFVPRAGLEATGRVDRLLVPGTGRAANPDPDVAAAADRAGVPLQYLHHQPDFAFDATLRDMAATMDVPTARWAAKILEYSSPELGLSGPAWPWMLALRVLLLGLTGVAAALGVAYLARRARTRRS
jgi:transcriptional regulator GlxA family with amidase domain